MNRTYRPTFIGLVILAYALLFLVYGVRWILNGEIRDGLGLLIFMIGGVVLSAWLDSTPKSKPTES